MSKNAENQAPAPKIKNTFLGQTSSHFSRSPPPSWISWWPLHLQILKRGPEMKWNETSISKLVRAKHMKALVLFLKTNSFLYIWRFSWDRGLIGIVQWKFPIHSLLIFLFLETTLVPQFLKYSHQLNFVYVSIECEHQIEIYLIKTLWKSVTRSPTATYLCAHGLFQRRRPICCTCRLCGAC